jgi:hypothetical protein
MQRGRQGPRSGPVFLCRPTATTPCAIPFGSGVIHAHTARRTGARAAPARKDFTPVLRPNIEFCYVVARIPGGPAQGAGFCENGRTMGAKRR